MKYNCLPITCNVSIIFIKQININILKVGFKSTYILSSEWSYNFNVCYELQMGVEVHSKIFYCYIK